MRSLCNDTRDIALHSRCAHRQLSFSRSYRLIKTKKTRPRRFRSKRQAATSLLQSFTQRTFAGLKDRSLSERDLVNLGPFRVSPLGLGTWAWGNKLLWGYDTGMDHELSEVFNLVVGRGINLFDTADSYGTGSLNGRSEQLLGDFTRAYPGPAKRRDTIRIATKLAPYPWRLTSAQFVAACRGSLRRLGAEKLAIGQLHWSTANYQPLQEGALWDGLVQLYDEGLVEAVGVSNYGPKQLQKIARYLEKRNVPLVTAQVQYSLISRGPQQLATKSACDDLGIKLISYSPLGLGMLTGKYKPKGGLPSGPRGLLFRSILPGLEPLLTEMEAIAKQRRKTIPQVAINWCICKGTIPIPGAKDLQQAKETLGALGWRLSPAEVAALEDAADQAPRGMLQNIFQTS